MNFNPKDVLNSFNGNMWKFAALLVVAVVVVFWLAPNLIEKLSVANDTKDLRIQLRECDSDYAELSSHLREVLSIQEEFLKVEERINEVPIEVSMSAEKSVDSLDYSVSPPPVFSTSVSDLKTRDSLLTLMKEGHISKMIGND